MKQINFILVLFVSAVFIAGCGNDEVKVSETGELLMSHQWKLQPNESMDAMADSIEDETGVDMHVELEGDVEKFADFVAETLIFTRDENDPTKLAYSSTIGEAPFSAETLGYWTLSDDDKELTLYKWNSEKGEQEEGVVYEIIEINDEKLVLKNKKTGGTKVYFVK